MSGLTRNTMPPRKAAPQQSSEGKTENQGQTDIPLLAKCPDKRDSNNKYTKKRSASKRKASTQDENQNAEPAVKLRKVKPQQAREPVKCMRIA